MSTGYPPKDSADWLAEQDGEDTTPTANGTQAAVGQPPQPEAAPEGTQAGTGQDGGHNAPAPAESKPTSQTDVTPTADKTAGVSSQNNADAVMGYDQQIAALREAADKSKPETEEERKRRERKERSRKIIAAVGDGVMALSNLYFTTRGAPNMYNHKTMSQQVPLQAQLDKLKAAREANADRYLQYSLKIGDLQNDRAKTLREMEAEQERRKLAREKAERENEAHGWLRALQPDKLREQKSKADKAASEATTAEEEAKNAPDMQAAKLDTEKARADNQRASAGAHRASATNSYASARAHDRSGKSGSGSGSGGSGGGRGKAYGTFNGVTYQTKADYDKAVVQYAKENGIPLTYDKKSTDAYGLTSSTKANRTIAGLAAEGEQHYRQRHAKPKPASRPAQKPQRKAAARPQQKKSYTNTRALGL